MDWGAELDWMWLLAHTSARDVWIRRYAPIAMLHRGPPALKALGPPAAGLISLSKQLPVPRQKFVEPVSRVLGDTGQNVGQPCLRIDVVHFCRDDDAVHGGSALSAANRVVVPWHL